MEVALPPSNTDNRSPELGFPIRKSLDQSPFAAPQGLSQRTTSFIASQHQGIHQIPLRHLIASIINAHPKTHLRRPLGRGLKSHPDDLLPSRRTRSSIDHTPGSSARPLDQLASTLSSGPSHARGPKGPRHVCGQARQSFDPDHKARQSADPCLAARPVGSNNPIIPNLQTKASNPQPKPPAQHPLRNRIESLFTMSKSQSMPLHRNRHQGHCHSPGANSAKLSSRLQPSRGRLTLCGTTLTTGGA